MANHDLEQLEHDAREMMKQGVIMIVLGLFFAGVIFCGFVLSIASLLSNG